MEIKEMYVIGAFIVTALSVIAFCVLFFHGGYADKVLIKLGLKEPKTGINWAVFSWDSCLEKLHYNSDIAFFGDSITRGGDFQKYFPNKRIINLGCSGDSIAGLTKRVSMLTHTSPKKVFIMAGINGLTDMNSSVSLETYSKLLTSVNQALPESEVYVQSVLPLSEAKAKELFCSNGTIKKFNQELEKLSVRNKMTFVDLFSAFEENGNLKNSLSVDGLHINPEGYAVWVDIIKKYVN